MNNENFENELSSQLQKLEKNKQPKRDLWQGIELAINQQELHQHEVKNSVSFRPAIAASVALILGVLWWNTPGEKILMQPSGETFLTLMQEEHQQQKLALLAHYSQQPAVTDNWQSQLDELDKAARAVTSALKQDADNLALLKMLQHIHTQQIALIKRVHDPKWSDLVPSKGEQI